MSRVQLERRARAVCRELALRILDRTVDYVDTVRNANGFSVERPGAERVL